ncbi:hypothetical protein Hdeb2414_s0014g00433561 [Helianthus debilis subsp. tardiflorus]
MIIPLLARSSKLFLVNFSLTKSLVFPAAQDMGIGWSNSSINCLKIGDRQIYF